MKQNIVKVNLLGCLGEHLGNKTYNLAINSVGAAMNAIEVLSKRRFYKFLQENDKKGIKYRVLINGRDFLCEKNPVLEKPESISNSELCAKIYGLKRIDIIPILEGAGGDAGSIGAIILGAVLIVAGIIVSIYGGGPLGAAMIIAGIGLIAAGVINLLSKGPELQEFTQRQKTSYLFSGPVNTINEGGAVPLQYGVGLIGSSVISASYDIEHFNADDTNRTT